MQKRLSQFGFSVIEIAIVVAIITLLAFVAVPSYFNYPQKDYFKNVVAAADAYKLAVEACYEKQGGSLANCGTPGMNGIPAASKAKDVKLITVASGGVVKAIGGDHKDIEGVTLILTPNVSNGVLIWFTSGSCIDEGLC